MDACFHVWLPAVGAQSENRRKTCSELVVNGPVFLAPCCHTEKVALLDEERMKKKTNEMVNRSFHLSRYYSNPLSELNLQLF